MVKRNQDEKEAKIQELYSGGRSAKEEEKVVAKAKDTVLATMAARKGMDAIKRKGVST